MLSFYYPTISSRKGERGTGGGEYRGGGTEDQSKGGGGEWGATQQQTACYGVKNIRNLHTVQCGEE